jgi:hypothetical protein
MTTSTNQEVAQTILSQLGGNRFIAMTGCSNFGSTPNSLSFKLPRGCKNKATHCTVSLDASDTYTVEFIKCNMRAAVYRQVVAETSMVYAESLTELFTAATGLEVRL